VERNVDGSVDYGKSMAFLDYGGYRPKCNEENKLRVYRIGIVFGPYDKELMDRGVTTIYSQLRAFNEDKNINKPGSLIAAHANIVIVDPKTKNIYRFEPNGSLTSWNDTVDDAIQSLMRGSLLKLSDYKYLRAATCGIGPQAITKDSFCANWTHLMAYLMIKCRKSFDDTLDFFRDKSKGYLVNLMNKWDCYMEVNGQVDIPL
jgi:hypothetical protein